MKAAIQNGYVTAWSQPEDEEQQKEPCDANATKNLIADETEAVVVEHVALRYLKAERSPVKFTTKERCCLMRRICKEDAADRSRKKAYARKLKSFVYHPRRRRGTMIWIENGSRQQQT